MIDSAYLPAPLYVLRCLKFLRRNRVLWKFAAAPMVISAGILTITYVGMYYLFLMLVGPLGNEEWYLKTIYYVLAVLLTAALVLVFFFFFVRVASAVAAPFNEALSQKTEEIISGRLQDAPFSLMKILKDASRSLSHSLKILGLYLFLLVICLIFLIIPGIGSLLFSGAGTILSAFMLSYEYLGYPMDRRRFSWNQKRRFLKERIRSVIGFGLGNLVMASIPVVNILFIPASVIGGTLLFRDLTKPAD